jgi:hypothetical protein
MPRGADGRPELRGTWSFATMTPLERPAELAGKATLTEQEAREFQARMSQERNNDRRDGFGTDTDVRRAYNAFWIDWGNRFIGGRTSLVIDPPDGKVPALTPDGKRRADLRASIKNRPASGPEDRGLEERCLQGFNAGPPIIPGPYNNHVQIFQTSGHVAILNEMVHTVRIVPLDGRPAIAPSMHLWSGDGRGRWNGDTLVIESANYRSEGTVMGFFTPGYNDEKMRLMERFAPVDRDTLMYEFTVDNPTTWTRPWSASFPMTRTGDRIYEYACHEGNHAMMGILGGARADDRRK